jgi:hypothetical protein
MKEQIKEAEEAMDQRLTEQSERMRRMASRLPTRERTEVEVRFSKWASQVPPELLELPPSPKKPSVPPSLPPKSKR